MGSARRVGDLGRHRPGIAVVVVVVLSLVAAACSSGSSPKASGSAGESAASNVPASAPAAAPGAPSSGNSAVIAAVGDLVCAFGTTPPPNHAAANEHGVCKPDDVARLVKKGNYDAFMPLGDLQYSYGGFWRYEKYWDRYYGSVKNITRPIIGNHEGYNGLFEGYYRYFGKRAHPPHGYYSYDLGEWHVMALNSQMCRNKVWGLKVHVKSPTTSTGYDKWISPIPGGGCEPGDPMYEWAKRDLAAHSDSMCTLALFHHPYYRWYGKTLFNPNSDQAPLWKLLDDNGVDVALNGHQHNYQRFVPLDSGGNPDPNGMTEIIVGTGGDSYQPLPDGPQPDIVAASETGTYGILQMTLDPGGYDFEFVPIPGDPSFQDSGTGECH